MGLTLWWSMTSPKHVYGGLFGAGAGIPRRPTLPAPGTDRLYYAPRIISNREYGISPNGFEDWVFGESTGLGDALTQDPSAPAMRSKRFVLRSLRVGPNADGELIFANRAPGTAWNNMPRRMVFQVLPDVPFSFDFGPLGVDLGDGAFIEWIGTSNSDRIWLEVAYDLR